MASPDTPAERALVALAVERQQARIDQASAEMQADLDAYRDDWTSRHAETMRVHNERCRQIEADQAEWLKSFYDDGDESAPTDVGQGRVEASATGPAPAPGRGPDQQPNPEAELAEAERIRSMSMAEYAASRAALGMRSPTDMSRLSGETR